MTWKLIRVAAKPLTPYDAERTESHMADLAIERGWQNDYKPYKDRSKIVHRLQNGWTIRQPIYNGDAFREGDLMSNCLSDFYNQDYDNYSHWDRRYISQPLDDFTYYSLRDKNNLPHITFCTDNKGIITNILGRHNSQPKPEYRAMVLDFAHRFLGDFDEYHGSSLDELGELSLTHSSDRSCCPNV